MSLRNDLEMGWCVSSVENLGVLVIAVVSLLVIHRIERLINKRF